MKPTLVHGPLTERERGLIEAASSLNDVLRTMVDRAIMPSSERAAIVVRVNMINTLLEQIISASENTGES